MDLYISINVVLLSLCAGIRVRSLVRLVNKSWQKIMLVDLL